MGVDVKLLPLLHPSMWVAHEIITLERRAELWPRLQRIPQQNIPQPLNCHEARLPDGERCYGPVEEDPYGGRLAFTTVDHLLNLKDESGVTDNWKNRAVWAYLAQMPPTWPIVIYWC